MKFTIFDRKLNKEINPEDFVINSKGELLKTEWIPWEGYEISLADEILYKKEPRYTYTVLK